MRGGNISNPNGIGGFRPGQSGNPGGRPHSLSAVRLQLGARAAEVGEQLIRLALKPGGDPVQLAAIREFFDRLYGKSPQAIDMKLALDKRINEMSLEELMAVEQKLLAAQATLPAALTVMDEQESLLDRIEGANGGDESSALGNFGVYEKTC